MFIFFYVFRIGAKDYLKEFKLDNKLNLEYLEEATDFSFSRKFRFDNFKSNIKKKYSFDFIKAVEKKFQISAKEIKLKQQASLEFSYKPDSIDELNYSIKQYVGKGAKTDNYLNGKLDFDLLKNQISEGN